MLRLIDVIAVAAVAVVLLLPKASVDARPALEGEPIELDRIAHLQDDVFREPTNVEALLALADGCLSFGRPDWAIATLSRFTRAEGLGEPWTAGRLARARVHLTLATARAERLEASHTVDEAALVERACADGPAECGPLLVRSGMIRGAMATLVEQHIDPAHDPQAAKAAVYKALHPSRSGF